MADVTKESADRSLFICAVDQSTGIVRRVAIPTDFQIGTTKAPAELQVYGRLSLSTSEHRVKNTTPNGVVNLSDDVTLASVFVESTTHPTIRVNLPPNPRDGQIVFVKDAAGVSESYQIDIFPASSGHFIDNSASISIALNYGGALVYWYDGMWHTLVTNLAASGGGGGGAPTTATYLTVTPNGTLTNERTLAVGSNITMSDGGANSTLTLNLSAILGGGAGSFTNANITVDAFGRITAISSGAGGSGGADRDVSFVVMSATGSLPNERVLSAGTNISIVDHGPGNPVVIHSTGGSVLPKSDNLMFVAGRQAIYTSIFEDIGAMEFNLSGPNSMVPSGSISFTAYFQPIVEVTPLGAIAEIRLYNVTTNTPVSNTTMTATSQTPTALKSVNLNGSLASSGTNVYTTQMRLQSASPGQGYSAICKGAKLFVTWT